MGTAPSTFSLAASPPCPNEITPPGDSHGSLFTGYLLISINPRMPRKTEKMCSYHNRTCHSHRSCPDWHWHSSLCKTKSNHNCQPAPFDNPFRSYPKVTQNITSYTTSSWVSGQILMDNRLVLDYLLVREGGVCAIWCTVPFCVHN